MTKLENILIGPVRLSYHDLVQPQNDFTLSSGEVIKGRYRAEVLVPKDTPSGKKIMKTIKEASKAAISAKWPSNPPKIKPDKYPWTDGDYLEDERYHGNWVIRAYEKPEYRPLLVDAKAQPIPEGQNPFYQGCYVNLLVRVYAYSAPMAKGVTCSLKGVQFVRDGEPMGYAPLKAEDVFKPVDGSEEFEGDDDDDDLPI